jgi:hypothetical protein
MIKALAAVAALSALAVSTSASAQDPKSLSSSFIPKTGFFIGAGRELQLGQVRSIAPRHIRRSDVFIGPDLIADGQAGGPPAHFNRDDISFAFDADVGYFQRLGSGPWLGGIKFTYKYLKSRVRRSQHHPRGGLNHNRWPARYHSLHRLRADPQLADQDQEPIRADALCRRSFGNLYIYAGGRLALFDTSAKIVDATGFAVIGGATANMTGAPASFSSSD